MRILFSSLTRLWHCTIYLNFQYLSFSQLWGGGNNGTYFLLDLLEELITLGCVTDLVSIYRHWLLFLISSSPPHTPTLHPSEIRSPVSLKHIWHLTTSYYLCYHQCQPSHWHFSPELFRGAPNLSLSDSSQSSRQNNPSKINHSSGQNSLVAPVWFKANIRVLTTDETDTRCVHPSPFCPPLPVLAHVFHSPNTGLLVSLCKWKHVLDSGLSKILFLQVSTWLSPSSLSSLISKVTFLEDPLWWHFTGV